MSTTEIIRTDTVLVREMALSAGAATEWHFHREVHDYFVCLEGAVRVETKRPDSTVVLAPGQRCQVSPGQAHRVSTQAGGTAKYLLVQGVGSYDFCPEVA